MKIVSWNVNGMRAAWGHGLATFLEEYEADIYAFQETKLTRPFPLAMKAGYEMYWNFCEEQRGYAGTAVMTRIKPLKVSYDMGDASLPIEGRILTLEFGYFCLVCCYFPNSLRSPERRNYRTEWDRAFIRYIGELRRTQKALIVCGDLNVVWLDEDNRGEVFESEIQTNLGEILEKGMLDSYRHLYPEAEGAYTWWSRKVNRAGNAPGRRLDYILVSDNMAGAVSEAAILSGAKGSDHLPVLLELDLEEEPGSRVRHWETLYTYDNLLRLEARRVPLSGLRCSNLGALWDSVDWARAEAHLADMQCALAKTAYSHISDAIAKWQRRIVYSIDAKLLAVKHVCDHAATAGVDGVKWTTSHEKMAAALALTSRDYRAMPSRMLLITCRGGKQRRVRIDTFYDRAMQTLYSYALDPVAESLGDAHSYAYRKGRSTFDINARIIEAFSGSDAPKWVLRADVRSCYDTMCHDWILSHIPLPRNVLREFLKSGFVFGSQHYQTDVGIGIGEPLSPIIANMVLDGMQEYVYSRLYPTGDIDPANGFMLRYADDIIVAARTAETARRIEDYIHYFLSERGLALAEEKTQITHINEGFTFMKRLYRSDGPRLYASPSEKAVDLFMANVRDTVEKYKGSQMSLIEKLNRMIDGWVTYHKVTEAREAFQRMDVHITALLLDFCRKRHPKWNIEQITQHYWHKDREGNRHFSLPERREVRVRRLSDTLFYQYGPVWPGMNPYTDTTYLSKRYRNRQIQSVTGSYRAVWEKQGGKCHYCGRPILPEEKKALVDVNPTHSYAVRNKAYVHWRCTSGSLDYIDSDIQPATLNELRELLEEMGEEDLQPITC